MNKLTVVIPFLNEGEEIINTVKSIRETAGSKVEILLINDASFDSYDYKRVANMYDAKYLNNDSRLGPAQSRDIGIENCETEFFLTVDGHMRFYNNNWWQLIIENLEKNKQAIFCTYCRPLDVYGNDIKNRPHFGAYIDFLGINGPKFVLSPIWIRKDWYPTETTVKIPCIFGATYTSSKEYWKYLNGLSGLKQYGLEEPYISIKAWMEGGGCYLIKNVEIAHLFRDEFLVPIDTDYYVYNRLLITETLLPSTLKNDVYNVLRQNESFHLRNAMNLLLDNQREIDCLMEYNKKIFKNDFDFFLRLNNEFVMLERNCGF